jgi:hypothetical protein
MRPIALIRLGRGHGAARVICLGLLLALALAGCAPAASIAPVAPAAAPTAVPMAASVATPPPTVAPATPAAAQEARTLRRPVAVTVLHTNDVMGEIDPCG